jgi:hypothetical protein
VRLGVYPREVQRSVAESARKHEPRLHHRVGADWKKRRATFHQDRRHCPPENAAAAAPKEKRKARGSGMREGEKDFDEKSTSDLDKAYSAHKTYTVPPQILPPCSPGISLEDA